MPSSLEGFYFVLYLEIRKYFRWIKVHFCLIHILIRRFRIAICRLLVLLVSHFCYKVVRKLFCWLTPRQ